MEQTPDLIKELHKTLEQIDFPFLIENISFAPRPINLKIKSIDDPCYYVCVKSVNVDGVDVCVEYKRICN